MMIDGGGYDLITKMVNELENYDVEILYNTQAIEIIEENNEVIGVKVINDNIIKTHLANERVIIASGGFSANVEMRVQYNEDWINVGNDILTSCPQGITGDGILMSEQIGAQLTHMDAIQLFHFANPATGSHYFLQNTRIKMGSFFVNENAERFVNEDSIRNTLAQNITKQPSMIAYEVFDEGILNDIQTNYDIGSYLIQWQNQDVLVKCEEIEECGEYFGLNEEALSASLEEYNEFIIKEDDSIFNRDLSGLTTLNAPYYMLIGKPSIHNTLGGIVINTKAQVLDQNGEIINNLYAAGEVTGGIFGEDRLATTAINDAIVFGRIAGKID